MQAIFAALEAGGAEIVEERDPCVLPKAIKNPVEQQGHRDAQARDGAAVSRFLHWLSVEAPKGGVTELAAADRLHEFRHETGDLRDLSFDTISGSGPNGAVVHYRASRGNQPDARARQRLSRRFGRAISRRHDRHHPHRVDRPGEPPPK